MLILPVLTIVLIIFLWKKKRLKKTAAILLLILCAAGGAGLVLESVGGAGEAVSQLAAGEKESALEVETADGKTHAVTIRVPEPTLTPREQQLALERAAEALPRRVLGKNESAERIEWNLELPAAPEPDITAFWSTDRPEILSWDGRIGEEVPPEGEAVYLTAILYMEEESREVSIPLRVFPSKEEDLLLARLQSEADALNATEPGGYVLPTELDGQRLAWFRPAERRAGPICALALLITLLLVLSEKEKEKKKKEERGEILEREYPAFVERVYLLCEAGLPVRRVVERLAGDHRRALREQKKSSPVYEETARLWYELCNGVEMNAALTSFGQRCGTPAYRGLALLIARAQKRGNALLLALLEKEVRESTEDRRRRAKAKGEKATVRLLLPMALMLGIVLVILVVPAMLSF